MGNLMGTTICAVQRDGKIAVAGDGQVTLSESVIFKSTAKARKLELLFVFFKKTSDYIYLYQKNERFFDTPKNHKNKNRLCRRLFTGRDRRIRTIGILLPKQALYQAELCPVINFILYNNSSPPLALLALFVF